MGELLDKYKPIIRNTKVVSFLDLEVYQRSFRASVIVTKEIIPHLPKEERFDLADQMRRAGKSIPALIAEGFAKRHQKRFFRKYLTDGIGEANEMIVHISFALELGHPKPTLCKELIEEYQIIGKQLYRLQEKWRSVDST